MIDNHQIPIGFTMELAQHTQALARFASMDEQQQCQIVDCARNIHSREEMREYVINSLGKGEAGHEAERFL